MPKNKKKNSANSERYSSKQHEQYSDDDSNDNSSVYSYQSESVTPVENGAENDSANMENSIEKYEEKLLQAIENISDKSLQTRINGFQTIIDLLVHHYMPDFIDDRKITIIDGIEKSIRRGKGSEQSWAARLIPLLIIQLDGVDELNEILKTLKQVLLATGQDNSAQFDARAKCCTALGLLYFLSADDINEILVLMKNLENIFAGSFLKGDKTPSSAGSEAGTLHSAALSAWSLLLTLIPSGDFVSLMNNQNMLPSIENLLGMLQSPHLEVRMTTGEAIALILEAGRQNDEEFLYDYLPDLIESTKQLATDAHKYRAKRDRKVQRATFRDVMRYLEEDVSPEIIIKFGRETLLLDTWSIHHQYTALCNAIGSGMSIHLVENNFLRDVLQLGAKLNDDIGHNMKLGKNEKKFLNAAAFKARTISRGKNRDKRSAVLN
uniref:Putative interferon-related developmental regulator n=1 Tax=Corethrella appendiculata TaxID=1370023 RepID=U5EVZ4_9DIPT